MLEGSQQQVRDEGPDDLDWQRLLAPPERLFDLEHPLNPSPPVLDGPSFFTGHWRKFDHFRVT